MVRLPEMRTTMMTYRNNIFLIAILIISIGKPLCSLGQTSAQMYNYSYLKAENGLSENFIDEIYKDKSGFMWFSTRNGLDRYDGYEFRNYSAFDSKNAIKSNFVKCVVEDNHNNLWIATESGINRLGLGSGVIDGFENLDIKNSKILSCPINVIIKDDNGSIWVGYNSGVGCITLDQNSGEIKSIETFELDVASDNILALCLHRGEIWAGGRHNIIRLSPIKKDVYQKSYVSSEITKYNGVNVMLSSGEHLLIGTRYGLVFANTVQGTSVRFRNSPDDPNSLSQNYVTSIVHDKSNRIIVGTLHGVNIYKGEGVFSSIVQGREGVSLNNNFINSLFVDEKDNLWVGTDVGGVNILAVKKISFDHTFFDPATEDYPSHIVNAIYRDKQNNLLVGLVDGGLNIMYSGQTKYKRFTHSDADKRSLRHNSVSYITQDHYGDFWIGTWGGGLNFLKQSDLHAPRFAIYEFAKSEINSNFISVLVPDSARGGIWLGTQDGINFLDYKSRKFYKVIDDIQSENHALTIYTGLVDNKNRVWFGGQALYMIDMNKSDVRKGVFSSTTFQYKLDNPEIKISEKINFITQTHDGKIWVVTSGNGMYLLNESDGKFTFKNYNQSCGLASNLIYTIVEDKNGNLWVGTNLGLSIFNPATERAVSFDKEDGLMSTQFYWASGFCDNQGHLYFGTTNGMIDFSTGFTQSPSSQRRVTITNLNVLNKDIQTLSDGNYISANISTAKRIELHERDKSFRLQFSALEYTGQRKIKYSYRLLGFDNHWNDAIADRTAVFTNLKAGKYTLQVKCTNEDGTWSSVITEIQITITPPFYKKIGFLTLCIVFFGFTIFYFIRNRAFRKERERRVLEQTVVERTEVIKEQNEILKDQNQLILNHQSQLVLMNESLERATAAKLAFFTNITHELKTPITLIIGPIERLMEKNTNQSINKQLSIVQRNSRYLLLLINQLMDFRKTEDGTGNVNLTDTDIVLLTESVLNNFIDIIAQRKLNLQLRFKTIYTKIRIDSDNIRQVITNLLSNAVKYTPNGGRIVVTVSQIDMKDDGRVLLYISVQNSGEHIPAKDIDSIFDRFYMVQNQKSYPMYGQSGTGIGLYLAKTNIEALGGRIWVRNNPNQSVSLRILLPCKHSEQEIEQITYLSEIPNTTQSDDQDIPIPHIDKNKPVLLLVEDNTDMRAFIKNILSERFNIIEAVNGKKGLELTLSMLPDFIISDLMMPVCDGITFCMHVKNNIVSSHIPFLLLTVKSSDETKIESYEKGADGYLTKPFGVSMLVARINSILENRTKLQKQLLGNLDLQSGGQGVDKPDKVFMNRLVTILEANYTNPEFGSTELLEKMNVSRSLLYKKLMSLTGLSASKFIVMFRLKVAKEHITENIKNKNLNISEIAYNVGFNDPKYFTRCFTKQYGYSPRSMLSTILEEES